MNGFQNFLRRCSLLLRKFNISDRFVRFVVVGTFNTAFGYAIFALIYLTTGFHRVAICLSLVVGVIVSFFSTGRLVFAQSGLSTFFAFVVSYGVICCANIVAVDMLARVGLSPIVGQIVTLPAMVLLSYNANARLVFRRSS